MSSIRLDRIGTGTEFGDAIKIIKPCRPRLSLDVFKIFARHSGTMALLQCMTEKHLDGLRLWSHWLSKQTTSLDVAAFAVATTAILLRCGWKYCKPSSDVIPAEFWYQVPQSKLSQMSLREKKAEDRNIAAAFRDHVGDGPIISNPKPLSIILV